MGIKVGINGFGRIGRNVMRTCLGDKRHRFRRGQRSDRHKNARASAEIRLDHGQSRPRDHGRGRHDQRRRRDLQGVFSEKDPAAIDWASVGAEIVIESTGRFTKAEDAVETSPRQRQKGHHLGSCKRRRRHDRARRQRGHVRRRQRTTSSQTLPARRTVSLRSRRSSTKNSASRMR